MGMDMRTGEMVGFEIPEGIREKLDELTGQQTRDQFRQLCSGQSGIPAEHLGPVFEIDEVVEVKGERFRVRGFDGGLLHLQGLPQL